MTRPDVSVIVVSFNTREMVRGCIASVLRQGKATIEVIVVDNASHDGTAQMVRETFPNVTLVANPDNRGFAAANDQALAVAKGRYALLLNPDAELIGAAIDESLAFADANPDAGIVGCRVMCEDGTQDATLFKLMTLGDVFFDAVVPIRVARRFKMLGYQRYAGRNMDEVFDVETVAGCFMLVRREAWEKSGVLDDDFFIYAEEAEWCWRIRRAGWKVRYFPGARVMHRGGASTVQVRPAMNLSLERSLLLLIQKTQGPLTAWIANLLMLVRDAPRTIVWLFVKAFRIRCSPVIDVSLQNSAARLPLHVRGIFRLDWRSEARKPPQAGKRAKKSADASAPASGAAHAAGSANP